MRSRGQEPITPNSKEIALLRKLVYRLAGVAPDEDTDMTLFEAAEAAAERVDVLEEDMTDLEADVSDAYQTAGKALTVVNQKVQDDDEISKTRLAYLNARDELVKRAAIDESAARGQGVTVADVQAMAAPERTLHYQQVKNAFEQLVEEWDCFRVGTNEDGDRRLEVRKDAVQEDLVGLVEESLDRDDLAKRFFSDHRNGGGS